VCHQGEKERVWNQRLFCQCITEAGGASLREVQKGGERAGKSHVCKGKEKERREPRGTWGGEGALTTMVSRWDTYRRNQSQAKNKG